MHYPKNSPKQSWLRWSSPRNFDALGAKLERPLLLLAAVLAALGLYWGFYLAPVDAVQGESYRIMFLHVPASWVAMITYLAMAFWSGVYLVFRTRLSAMMAQALAPTGALMTVLSLATGALWGKPTWGTYWVWDARLTSMLLLLFLYLGFIALTRGITPASRADGAGSILALVGVVNVPIIYFSVVWWNTLHQGASISFDSGVSMHPTMLTALLLMSAAAWFYAIGTVVRRLRVLILEREAQSDWVGERYGSASALPQSAPTEQRT
ncbi:heme ABC transporter permease CcmC [Achromobacter sp. F4_2707]|uniref:heme ABC transporter permease CcmC n=1 Tax=Achromobacter sp. F4_2707 TaxID=3114286 RepID=UPI0039C5BCBE